LALRITPAHYAAQALLLTSALTSRAVQLGLNYYDAQDAVQEAVLSGLNSLETYDHRTEALFAAWLLTILERRVLDEHRRKRSREKRECAWSCETQQIAESRWAALRSDDARARLRDVELMATAKVRMRTAPLSAIEREVLGRHLDGESQQEIGLNLCVRKSTVGFILRHAIELLRSSTAEGMDEPDLDWYRAMIDKVDIYHRPEKLGARLYRERAAKLK